MTAIDRTAANVTAARQLIADRGGVCNAHHAWPDDEWRCAVPTCPGRDRGPGREGATA